MKILGIDTILHDLCVAVMEEGRVLSNKVSHRNIPSIKNSLLDLTQIHLQEIGVVLKKALSRAGISISDISLIAVNNRGSLFSNVLIGVSAANILSELYNIPVVDVGHQEAHIFSNWIERDLNEFSFPIMVFSASGGHSSVALIQNKNFKFKILDEVKGVRRNNSMKLSFIGIGTFFSDAICIMGLKDSKERNKGDGQLISSLAQRGDASRFIFSAELSKIARCFDFDHYHSKIKKDLKYFIEKEKKKKGGKLSNQFIYDLAASFEDFLSEIVINYLCFIAQEYQVKEIHLAGGLSANNVLRGKLRKKTKLMGIVGRWPKRKSYCTDNAVMIANLGYYKFKKNPRKYLKKRNLPIKSDLILENIAIGQFLANNKKLE